MRPLLTQREAAAACGVSLSTIRRRREGGEFPSTRRDPVRGWLISVDELLAAGLRLHAPAPPDEQPTADRGAWAVSTPGEHPAHGASMTHAQALMDELLTARHRAEIAEAEARLLREHLGDLRQLLRALTPAPPAPPADQDLSEAEPPTVPAQSEGHDQPPAPPMTTRQTDDTRPARWWRPGR
ncbi:helix-turn-helix domain-containing protein [Streptomyces jumonjinensis]|uniref:Helix-turn-helix domain-containing protein n=1 Tax=Streptomyces jumonjinensis TaxID=1945 RepID=A0A646KAB1_STRJU|nr:helix-turn-helix domain-containing protein [Streptomyces jumonjinensis]MQS99029.1 hypothetical protein [Streptomyces jumonjinensis]